MTGKVRYYRIDGYLHTVRQWATERGFTPHGLARSSGLGPGTLAKMMDLSWNPRAATLRTLEDYMFDYDELRNAAIEKAKQEQQKRLEQQEQRKSLEEQYGNLTQVEQNLIHAYMANLRKKR